MIPHASQVRSRRREGTRERLRRAALARFAEVGFERAGVAEIAAAAGVSERTFFRHFPRKEAVLFEDFASRLGWFRAALELRPRDEDVLESVRVAVESFPDDREVVRQVARLRGQLLSNQVIEEQMQRVQSGFSREIEEHLLARLPDGPGRALTAAVLSAAISGALLAALRLWGEGGGRNTDELRALTGRALALLRGTPAAAAARGRPASAADDSRLS